ncbi:MAG: hypothetical protein HGB02_03630 [Chlorobiaceae bacterium]|nr:hypothetical protein [Chlorobiaceae bacterium]
MGAAPSAVVIAMIPTASTGTPAEMTVPARLCVCPIIDNPELGTPEDAPDAPMVYTIVNVAPESSGDPELSAADPRV